MPIFLSQNHRSQSIGKPKPAAYSAGRIKIFGLLLLLLFLSLMPSKWAISQAEAVDVDPAQVKAAFVYNFIKFISWPPDALPPSAARIKLCVLGNDPLGNALNSLSGKTANGKMLSVKQIDRKEEASDCQILYVCKSESRHMKEILRSVKDGVLTIGNMKNFVSSGGMINFFIENRRISFEINPDAASKDGIRISSQLLRLAKIVRDDD